MSKHTTAITGLLLFAVLAALVSVPTPARAEDKTVADVNGQKITEAQLLASLLERYGYQVREQLIEMAAVEQEAKRRNLTVTEEEIDKALDTLRKDVETRSRTTGENFEMWLAKQSLTVSALRQRLRKQLLLEKMVKGDIVVTDKDVSDYYTAHRQEMARPEAVKISHIAVATREEADKIRVEIAAGKTTWEDAAKKHSLDPYGRDNGGVIGFIVRGEQPLQKAGFALQRDGDISQPFQDDMGWHLLRREAYQTAGTPPFEEVDDQIRQMITVGRTQIAVTKRLQALLELADIKRFGDLKPAGQ